VLALYVLALGISPLLHCGDVDCDSKAPTHCQACLASPSALPPVTALADGATRLVLIGHVAALVPLQQPHSVATDVAGRAPPA
jgi:hypothetical protein